MSSESEKSVVLSVIVPARNESNVILQTLPSLLSQEFPEEKYEVILVDGCSTDGTEKIAREILERSSICFRILRNEKMEPASSFNLGLVYARGKYIARCDAHTIYERDFLKNAVRILEEKNAHFVGGHQIPLSRGIRAKAISFFLKSTFGTGGGSFRKIDREGWADTAYMGVYRKEVFEHLGGLDEELYGSEDDTFHYLMREKGFGIYLSSHLKCYYVVPGRIFDNVKRFYRYGRGKARALIKYRRWKPLRQFVPPLFLLYLLFSIPFSYLYSFLSLYIFFPLFLYGILDFLVFLKNFFQSPLPAILSFFLFPVFHLSYGLGFLLGLKR